MKSNLMKIKHILSNYKFQIHMGKQISFSLEHKSNKMVDISLHQTQITLLPHQKAIDENQMLIEQVQSSNAYFKQN